MLRRIRNYIIVIVLVSLYLWSQNNILEIEKIVIEEESITKEVVIAHISDVHIPKNGPEIDTILNKLKSIKPDIIITTGDIVDSSCDISSSQLGEFAKGLSDIAPTYGVSGNHEIWNDDRNLWYDTMENNNNILDNSTKVIRIKGQDILLMGIRDGYNLSSIEVTESIKNSNMPKILMIHRPNKYQYSDIDISIIMSGHNHGGQIRVPFINRGILYPERKLLTKYSSGLYTLPNKEKLVISRGLGNSAIPIRIHNRPHLPIIILK